MRGYKNILFGTVMLAMLMPLLQQIYPLIPTQPLKGAFEIPPKPVLSAENWWTGDFQQEYNAYYEYQLGLRPFLIRLRNQLYFWLYHQSTTYVTPGSANQFYSWDYWAAYRGLDFSGEENVSKKVDLLAALRDTLETSGKQLLCVIAPNKVRYMPEYLPERLSKSPGEVTNYNSFKKQLQEAKIPLLDFNESFLQRKDTVLKPLFANTSIHWSGYGMHLAISEIIAQLEVLGQRSLVGLRYADWVMKDSSIHSDRDMVDLMNLLHSPATEPLAFPVYDLDDSEGAQPARVLIVGDSFFWNFYAFEVRKQIFHPDSRFLYYNKSIMDLDGNKRALDPESIEALVEQVDYVVILATESNLNQFPYGFASSYLGK